MSWNCRRASAAHDLWRHFAELSPDIAVLQEVTALPPEILSAYHSRTATPVGKTGKAQRFRSVILARGSISNELRLSSSVDWVDAELAHFAGNLPAYRVTAPGFGDLMLVNVYSPAWPVDRARLQPHDVSAVKLKQNPDLWVSDLLVAALREHLLDTSTEWVVAGDFNACESFDQWKGGPRGNREWLDRMASLGLRDCLRSHQGSLTPTFRRAGSVVAKSQIDYIFATTQLSQRLVSCSVGDAAEVYEHGLSDHLPVVAHFDGSVRAA